MRRLRFDATELLMLVLLVLTAALFVVAVSCTPATDLFREAGMGGTGPGGGSAAGALVDPPAGSTGLPTNLAAVTVRLPVAIQVPGADFRLHDSEGGAAAMLGTPVAVACPPGPAATVAGSCYRLPLTGGLAPTRGYVLELLAAIGLPDGAPAATGVIGAFDIGADGDATAPRVVDFAVAIAGPCVGVRFATDEPVDALVVLRTEDGASISIAAGVGLSAFDVAAPLAGLPAGAQAEIVIRAVDRAGNPGEVGAGAVEVPPETPPLAITEVLANPAGPEPGQEFVELHNLGDADVALGGLRLEDAKGADVLPEATLAPGAYALVVPSSFDPNSTRDVAPRAGTLMVPVDARLGADGLSNGGEVVRLRMPGTGAEAIVSSYGGWVDVSATSAAGKSAHRLGDAACDHPSVWTRPPRAATPGWGLP